jgi:hypothetical protein
LFNFDDGGGLRIANPPLRFGYFNDKYAHFWTQCLIIEDCTLLVEPILSHKLLIKEKLGFVAMWGEKHSEKRLKKPEKNILLL